MRLRMLHFMVTGIFFLVPSVAFANDGLLSPISSTVNETIQQTTEAVDNTVKNSSAGTDGKGEQSSDSGSVLDDKGLTDQITDTVTKVGLPAETVEDTTDVVKDTVDESTNVVAEATETVDEISDTVDGTISNTVDNAVSDITSSGSINVSTNKSTSVSVKNDPVHIDSDEDIDVDISVEDVPEPKQAVSENDMNQKEAYADFEKKTADQGKSYDIRSASKLDGHTINEMIKNGDRPLKESDPFEYPLNYNNDAIVPTNASGFTYSRASTTGGSNSTNTSSFSSGFAAVLLTGNVTNDEKRGVSPATIGFFHEQWVNAPPAPPPK